MWAMGRWGEGLAVRKRLEERSRTIGGKLGLCCGIFSGQRKKITLRGSITSKADQKRDNVREIEQKGVNVMEVGRAGLLSKKQQLRIMKGL